MTTQVMKTRPSGQLTLRDRLSRLTYLEACKLLGPEGKKLIQKANQWEFKIAEHVYLGDDLFRLRFPGESANGQPLVVTITLMAEARNRLNFNCTRCDGACEHIGAAFSLILEDKTPLGLAAAPPPPRVPVESLDEGELVSRALAERAERAIQEKMTVQSADVKRPWTDYSVTNRLSGKSYRVALHGPQPGESFCSCPDFRTNTLGTCKHVLHVLRKIKRKFTPAELKRPYRRKHLGLNLRYAHDVTLRLLLPEKLDDAVARIVAPIKDRPIEDPHDLVHRLAELEKLGHGVTVYPDAEEFIEQRLVQERLRGKMAAIRRDPAEHPLRTALLKVPLLPSQLDGVAFAASPGGAIRADDMGRGKTIRGVGRAEILARGAEITKVLVICPASLKSQWRGEIRRFCGRDAQLIRGAVRD